MNNLRNIIVLSPTFLEDTFHMAADRNTYLIANYSYWKSLLMQDTVKTLEVIELYWSKQTVQIICKENYKNDSPIYGNVFWNFAEEFCFCIYIFWVQFKLDRVFIGRFYFLKWNRYRIDTKPDSLITIKVHLSTSNNSDADYLLPESFYVSICRGFMTTIENARSKKNF